MMTQSQFVEQVELFLAENPEFTYERVLSVVKARVQTLAVSKNRREYDKVAREFFRKAELRGEAAVNARNASGQGPLSMYSTRSGQ